LTIASISDLEYFVSSRTGELKLSSYIRRANSMKVKVISVSVLTTSSVSIIFLLSPGISVKQILDQPKVEDCVLFPAKDPGRLYEPKEELYDCVQNTERLIAASLADATEAYRRSRAYHYPTQPYPIGEPS
jgi:DTW domain-containing protein YfiP